MRKNKIKKIFIFLIISILYFVLLSFLNKSNANENIEDGLPEFYGTTSITIRVNDNLDLKSGMYRILAKDNLDGNITRNIKVDSNNVNNKVQGSYEIKYSVTNSRNKTAYITVPVNVINDGDRKIQRTLYIPPDSSHLNDTEFYRGNIQDKQNLGLFLPAYKKVQVKQINKNFKGEVFISFFNDNALTEANSPQNYFINLPSEIQDIYYVKTSDKRIKIKDSTENYVEAKNETEAKLKIKGDPDIAENWKIWEEYTGKSYDSIPCIEVYNGSGENPVLDIILNDDVKSLDFFVYGDNDTEFKDKWEQSKNGFSILDGSRMQYIVPYKDLEDLGKSKRTTGDLNDSFRHDTFNKIDDIIGYYDDLIEKYDNWIGLSYNAEEYYNKNVKTKFLIKVDRHGPLGGYNYISWISIADKTRDTLEGILHNTDSGWIYLHEIGHGYQGYLKNTDVYEDLYLGEISNNFLADHFQKTILKEPYADILKGFDDEECEKTVKLARETNETFLTSHTGVEHPVTKNGVNAYNIRYFPYINLFNKIGFEKALSEAYKYSRKIYFEDPISMKNQKVKEKTKDIFAKKFSEGTEYNVIPYFEDWKLEIDPKVKKDVFDQDFPMVWYLKDLVEDVDSIKNELKLEWNYSLVSNQDIKKYNKTGNLTINITENSSEVLNKTLYLKSGKEIVKQINIDKNNINITNIPIGIYEVEVQNIDNTYVPNHVVISENKTTELRTEQRKMVDIVITKKPTRLRYVAGETFDPTGMEIKGFYNNGVEFEIKNYIITPSEKLSTNNNWVEIQYEAEDGKTYKILQGIQVYPKKVAEKIEISSNPTRMIYEIGESFDPRGMKVRAIYNNEVVEELQENKYKINSKEKLTESDNTIQIEYTNEENRILTTELKIQVVKKKEIEKIEIINEPSKKEYIEGENFSPNGMKVKVIYNNGTEELVDDFEVKNGNNLKLNENKIIISYTKDGKTVQTTYTITVKKKEIKEIKIIQDANKKEYIEGENFDPTGMKVKIIYNNGTEEVVNDFEIKNGNNLKVNDNKIVISYTKDGKTVETSYNITVKERNIGQQIDNENENKQSESMHTSNNNQQNNNDNKNQNNKGPNIADNIENAESDKNIIDNTVSTKSLDVVSADTKNGIIPYTGLSTILPLIIGIIIVIGISGYMIYIKYKVVK